MSINGVQDVLERLPILPAGVRPTDLPRQLKMSRARRQGFAHSNGEWNFIYVYENKQYRLPENLAIVLANQYPKELH